MQYRLGCCPLAPARCLASRRQLSPTSIASNPNTSKLSSCKATPFIAGSSLRNRGALLAMKAVWAFDFDGVVCDSVGESSESAWKAAARVWPGLFNSEEAAKEKPRVLEGMRVSRPVIETGFENIVQVRCLLEGKTPEDVLDNWATMLPDCMQQWGLERNQLVETFGGTRDDWMAEDLQGWLQKNGIYSRLPEILRHIMQNDELYIVTTKQARFTEALLRDMAEVPLPADRIFSQAESGRPKSEVLQMLEQRHPGTDYHFIEDKMGTLEKVMKLEELSKWQLYLVDWGYNTVAERERAAASGRIEVIDKGRLAALTGAS